MLVVAKTICLLPLIYQEHALQATPAGSVITENLSLVIVVHMNLIVQHLVTIPLILTLALILT